MKKVWIILTVMALSVATLWAQDAKNNEETKLDTVEQKYSYLIGMSQATSLAQLKEAIDVDAFLYGLKDGLEGNEMPMTEEEANEAKEVFEQRVQKLQEEQMAQTRKEGVENKEKADEFLENNKEKEGVKSTESGLQYKALEEAKGKSPDMDSLVTVHYEGKLMDGTVFDSSYKRGEPAQFHLRQVVPGFGEGITLMNTGEKYRLFIPPALGYGPQAPSPQIPANALLIFDVELIDFEEQKMPENPQMQQKRR